MAFNTRLQAFLAKIESTPGEAESLSASTDAILLNDISTPPAPQTNLIEATEVTGTLDTGKPHQGSFTWQKPAQIALKGSGTAGEAPESSPLWKISGMREKVQSDPIPDTGTSTATGGTTTSFDIDTSVDTDWPTSEGEIEGMPVTLSVNPDPAVTTTITDTSISGDTLTVTVAHEFDSALDNTTEAKIEPNVTYIPSSTSIPHATAEHYEDGVKDQIVGMAGSFSLTLNSGDAGVWLADFTLSGIKNTQTDAAVPSVTLDDTRPPIWKNGKALVNRQAVGLSQLTMDPNNTVTFLADPNAEGGFSLPEIQVRNIQGQIDPIRRLVATDDVMTQFQNLTEVVLMAMNGSTTGNQVAVTIPRAVYRDRQPADRQGFRVDTLPFSAVGEDDNVYITFF